MTKHPELPPRVYPKGRWYYLVTAEGSKRVWTKLSLIRAGMPALYRRLSDVAARDIATDRMPALITDWLDEVGAKHGAKQQANDRWVMAAISTAFAEFRARDVSTPACIAFLKPYRAKPRTHNEMRAGLRELMRYAETKESNGVVFRDPGTNPVASIKTLPTPPRTRCPTDSELRRIKVAAFYGADGKRTRQGATLAALIDLAYLTGQRIGDLLDLRWNRRSALNAKGEPDAGYIAAEGVYFKPSKTQNSTGVMILIGWTPRLRDTIKRIEAMEKRNLHFVITSQEAQEYSYEAFKSAWARALKRSGVKGLHFHDLRAKALTDTEELHGHKAAQRKGGHTTEQQTADYLRNKKAQKSEATR